ncbi:MAG: NAD(P)-binding domain-containing protein [Clostridia bacterium]|nr:NAD(P)-binding domain-containing protein [Clostridia bacterium]
MKKQFKLGVIGCGFDAISVLRGVVLSDFIREKKIIVSDKDEAQLDKVEYLGICTTLDNRFVAENSEYVLLAVSIKDFDKVAEDISGIRLEKVISIIGGLPKSHIKNALGVGLIRVARAVMNIPCSIGSGTIGIDMLDYNKCTDDTDFISNIFNKLGVVVSLEESKLDAISAMCGNSAHTLMYIDALIDAGTKCGLSKSEAKILAVQSVLGTAEILQREEYTGEQLMLQTCNDGNCALESVKVLENGDFRKLICNAVSASEAKIKEYRK